MSARSGQCLVADDENQEDVVNPHDDGDIDAVDDDDDATVMMFVVVMLLVMMLLMQMRGGCRCCGC